MLKADKDWWKWGEPAKRKSLTDYPKLKNYVEQRWGVSLNDKNEYGDPNTSSNANAAEKIAALFKQQLPQLKVKTDYATRLNKALGKSYADLLKAIKDISFHLPDAVALPANHDEVLQLLSVAAANKITIVPFGGGSNVVGAFNMKQPQPEQLVLDMAEIKSLIELDEQNHTAIFGAGIYGPALESGLNKKGYTLGHFPQSFEYSTLGGWIATRSAGQESSSYGRIEDIVIAVKVATPVGAITTSGYEGDAEGINIKSLFYGSEGMLGVVTEAKVRIHPLPQHKKWAVAVFPNFENGVAAIRELVQQDIFPSVIRYSDENETFFLSLLSHETPSGFSKIKASLSKKILKWKGIERPNLMMIRMDGSDEDAGVKRAEAAAVMRKYKGFLAGESLGKKWETSRFGLPYLRDDLMERGVFVDTMETVLPWNKLADFRKSLYDKLKQSTAFGKEKGILLAHVSHVYTSGASIYLTVLTYMDNEKLYQQWTEIKTIVTDFIVQWGGAVSHHHSIGLDHQKWYLQKTDNLTKEVLRAVKRTLDPNHIMNPGKLFDE